MENELLLIIQGWCAKHKVDALRGAEQSLAKAIIDVGYLSPEEVGKKVYEETKRQRDKRKTLREWYYAKIEEAKKQIFEEIESKSHRQATNMLGISLSKEDWQALKGGGE